jgi:phosphonoacetaldehyde hydrolase
VDAIRTRWREVHGKNPDDDDVGAMFADFVPMQVECLPQYTPLLPGAADAVQTLQRDYGVKIGVSTGFTRVMVDVLLAAAKKQGLHPDATVAGDEVAHGARPKPFMVYRNLDLLDIHPIASVVKVDDTTSGVGEGVQAGCWTVGVARYSNYMDIDAMEQAEKMSEEELARRTAHCRDLLRDAGAHYIADSIAELPAIIDDINQRLAAGEKP